MSYRDAVLKRLAERGFNEEKLADQLVDVIEGRRVTRIFDGKGVLKEVREVVSPQDAAKGLMIADTIMGGELGLSPKKIVTLTPHDALYQQFVPKRDNRIIARPVIVSIPETESAPPIMEQVADVLMVPTEQEVSNDTDEDF